MKADNDLYRTLRALSATQLWQEEVPKFNRASAQDRQRQVGLIRAVGVVFSTTQHLALKAEVVEWMKGLLNDPSEKVRRYAIAAIPKLGGDLEAEKKILSIVQTSQVDREKRKAGAALEKIAGEETLKAVAGKKEALPFSEHKVRANVARKEGPGKIRMDAVMDRYDTLRISLRCRRGLEAVLAEEVRESEDKGGKFRLLEVRGCHVVVAAKGPFTLAELYQLRCFDTVGFGLGRVRDPQSSNAIEGLSQLIGSELTERLMSHYTDGSWRYRLAFSGSRNRDEEVQEIAKAAFKVNAKILNDPIEAPWSIDVFVAPTAAIVELRPKVSPDPRLAYRVNAVSAASHPPIAACMARLAGRQDNEVIWDPFCGSGLELIESAILGGVKQVVGTDVSESAVAMTKANFAAAKLAGVKGGFYTSDFRNFNAIPELARGKVSLIISNPPLGRRVRVPNLHGLFEDLFKVASEVLRPGGRLIFVNPVRVEPQDKSLRRTYRQEVDLGGYDCKMEMYVKL
jgi:23S rRNA G2445 N2-methylase RlmL